MQRLKIGGSRLLEEPKTRSIEAAEDPTKGRNARCPGIDKLVVGWSKTGGKVGRHLDRHFCEEEEVLRQTLN